MSEVVEATSDQIPLARELFIEYAATLEFDLGFQDFDQEVQSLPGAYSRPAGCLLLAFDDSQLAACAALKPIDENICEMKRLYVRPNFQGRRIGRTLVVEILKKATEMGYTKIRLDTVPGMTAAIKLYESFGFYPIAPYRENPIPGTRYFERDLTSVA